MNLNRKQKKLSSFFSPGKTSPSSSGVSSTKKRRKDHNIEVDVVSSVTKKHVEDAWWRRLRPERKAMPAGEDSSMCSSSSSSRFQQCIICNKSFPRHLLIHHASNCVGNEGQHTRSQYGQHSSKEKKEDISQNPNQGRFSLCQICNKSIPSYDLSRHVQTCNDGSEMTESKLEMTVSCDTKGHSSSEKKVSPSTKIQLSQEWRKIIKDVATAEDKDKQKQYDTVQIRDEFLPISEPLPGLFLLDNFITEDEEHIIVKHLDSSEQSQTDWKHATFNGRHFGKRWGVHCNLRDRRVYPEEAPLPSFIIDLIIPKLEKLEFMKGSIPNEANAISYERAKGHFLKSHVDDRQLSKEVIANLSLAGDCLMTFTLEKRNKLVKHSRNGDMRELPEQHKVLLRSRTLQVLTGSARYDYSHGIANQDLLSDRRISLTMRQSPLTK